MLTIQVKKRSTEKNLHVLHDYLKSLQLKGIMDIGTSEHVVGPIDDYLETYRVYGRELAQHGRIEQPMVIWYDPEHNLVLKAKVLHPEIRDYITWVMLSDQTVRGSEVIEPPKNIEYLDYNIRQGIMHLQHNPVSNRAEFGGNNYIFESFGKGSGVYQLFRDHLFGTFRFVRPA